MPSVRSTASMIENEGEPIVLRRLGTNAATDLPLTGFVRSYEPVELVEDIIQGDREVVISNDEIEEASWPGPPRRDDQVIIGGRTTTIRYVDTVRYRGDILRHNIHVRGQ